MNNSGLLIARVREFGLIRSVTPWLTASKFIQKKNKATKSLAQFVSCRSIKGRSRINFRSVESSISPMNLL